MRLFSVFFKNRFFCKFFIKISTSIIILSMFFAETLFAKDNFQTYNNFETQLYLFRLPNYSLNEYRDVVNIRVDDIFEIKSPYLSFKNWLSIEPSIGFDSLSQNSIGMKKNLLQLKEFSLSLTTKNFNIEIGRLYPLGYPPYDIINGGSFSIYIKNFTLSFITGESITENSFLGKVSYFDDFSYQNYDYNTIFISWSSDIFLIKGGFWQQQLEKEIVYDQLELSAFFDYKKLSISSFFKYSPTLEKVSFGYFDISYKNFGLKYQYDNPTFLFDSIWNLFYFEKKHLISFYYGDNLTFFNYFKVKTLEIAFLNEISAWNLIGRVTFGNLFLLNFDYVYKNYIYSSLEFDWYLNFKADFRYSNENSFYSQSFTINYSLKLYQTASLNISASIVNSTFYGVQCIGGFFLNTKI